MFFDNFKPSGSREDPLSANYDMNYDPFTEEKKRENAERFYDPSWDQEEFIKQSEETINKITKENNNEQRTKNP